MNNKIYISGPMSNLFLHNYPAFFIVHFILRLRGWKVINPAFNSFKICIKNKCWFTSIPYEKWIEYDLADLKKANVIFMMKFWSKSQGAKKEFLKAVELKLKIAFQSCGYPVFNKT